MFFMIKSKKLVHGLLVGLLSALVAAGFWAAGWLDRWEYTTWAWRVRYFAHPGPTTDKIKVILLDQASLDWGKEQNGWSWPWPREVYGPIIDFCARGGAKVVAFDVLYTEPSMYGVSDDESLSAAIGRAPAFVGTVMLSDKNGEFTNWPAEYPRKDHLIAGLASWLAENRARRVTYTKATFPIPEVATNVTILGNVADQPDVDSIFRRSSLFSVFDGQAVPSLGLAAFLAAEEKSGARLNLRLDGRWLHVMDRKIPVDRSGRAILHFYGRSGTHEVLGASGIIESELMIREGRQPRIDPAVLKDCYVLFGFSAPALLDLRPIPISRVYPGVEIHATMLDNLLSMQFLKDVPALAVILFTLIMTLVSSLLGVFSRKAWQSVVAFVVFLPIPVVAGFLMYRAGFWLPMVAPVLGVVLALVSAVVVNYATEGRQKAFIKQAFKHYLGEEVIDQLIDDPSRLSLGGEKRELTLFFSDIEKFSSFSERLDPPTLTALLNDFLTDMTDIILEEGGYLDKYIGDAIVAFWNAPLGQPDHAARACRAAIRCQRKLAERRPEFFERTGATLKMRIGLNSGDVVVGNMGSRERFNYTVLGDAANLASRLEGANKAFGTYIMVSGSTWTRTQNQFLGREIGRLRVVGRQTPVQVYELSGLQGEEMPACYLKFADGLTYYYNNRLADALKIFESLPDDPVSKSYMERCRKALRDPQSGWDGVLNLTEK